MKRRLTLFLSLVLTLAALAQSPKAIEADLLKSFKEIGYWSQRQSSTAIDAVGALDKANSEFGRKLETYSLKYPLTITYPFKSLVAEHLNIITSDDNLFRIYSWDDQTGGTMRFFNNVINYKAGSKNKVLVDLQKKDGDTGIGYYKLYTMRAGHQTYYLAASEGVGSSRYFVYGLQIFTIENGELKRDTKLIKTQTGLHSQLTFDYDAVISDRKIKPDFYYDANQKTIRFPLTSESGKITTKFITYKFTGKYFERVKS